MNALRIVTIAFAAHFASGCGGDDSGVLRGHGLSVATLSPEAQGGVYDAAARAAFDLNDPNQSLLLDRRGLPRTVGLAAGDTLPPAVEAEMRRLGSIKGVCQPSITDSRKTVRCTAVLPGYVIRFSPVFAMASDTVEVYLFAQNYDNASSGYSPPLRFERAYQVVRSPAGDSWRAAREGRIPKEVRGDKR
jgi:hypothetical protein